MTETNNQPLLEVRDLKTYFFTEDGVVQAVDGVDFEVQPGEILGLVGESGCGKSVTSFSILRLIDDPGRTVGGEIYFEGRNVLELSDEEMVDMRGNRISMIFQQPQTSLNPVFTVGRQIAEVFHIHDKKITKKKAWQNAVDLLTLVGVADAERKAKAFPHEMSGGQAQRVMIAMALALKPKLLIADEPTTALDVTIQAQILDLMLDLRNRLGTSVILITHDLGLIAEMADRVAVMYAGRIVEQSDVHTLFKEPKHPYTQGLIDSVPVLGQLKGELAVIPGSVPNLIGLPPGCRFASRCQARLEYDLQICTQVEPDLIDIDNAHTVRCWLYQDHEGHTAPLQNELSGKSE